MPWPGCARQEPNLLPDCRLMESEGSSPPMSWRGHGGIRPVLNRLGPQIGARKNGFAQWGQSKLASLNLVIERANPRTRGDCAGQPHRFVDRRLGGRMLCQTVTQSCGGRPRSEQAGEVSPGAVYQPEYFHPAIARWVSEWDHSSSAVRRSRRP